MKLEDVTTPSTHTGTRSHGTEKNTCALQLLQLLVGNIFSLIIALYSDSRFE